MSEKTSNVPTAAKTQKAAGEEPVVNSWMTGFARQVDRGYRKFWAKRGINTSDFKGDYNYFQRSVGSNS